MLSSLASFYLLAVPSLFLSGDSEGREACCATVCAGGSIGLDWATEQQHHPGNSAPYYMAAWMRGVLGEQGYTPTAESFCCPPETMTMLLSATLQCRRKSLQNQTKPVSLMLLACRFHICNSACLLKRICGPQADAHVLSRHVDTCGAAYTLRCSLHLFLSWAQSRKHSAFLVQLWPCKQVSFSWATQYYIFHIFVLFCWWFCSLKWPLV